MTAADAHHMTTATRRPRLRASVSSDAGFSLVETVVAMTVAALLFGAVGGVLLVSLKATLAGRQAQQAADLANRTVERLRNRDYTTLGMDSTDAATDTAITGSTYTVPLANGGTSTEPIVLVPQGPIAPHVTTTQPMDGTAFTVARYVTSPPADATGGATYKRVTVVVSWRTGTRSRSRSTSTLVSQSRRGLPAPAFDVRVTAPPTTTRGASFTVRVAVTNLGVRSHWAITRTTTLGTSTTDRAWPVTWYSDNGATGSCNGVRDADETTPAQVDSADTGLISSGATGCLIGQYTVPGSEPQWTTYNLAVTASVTTAAGVEATQSRRQTRAAQVQVQ
jgi:type II secretory pathway pseudopilin PulG